MSENRGIIWLGAVGKIAFFGLVTYAFHTDHATWLAWWVSIGDLSWALIFLWFLCRTKDRVRVSNLLG